MLSASVFTLGTLVALVPAAAASADEPPCTDCHDAEAAPAPDHVHTSLECIDCHAGTDRVPHAKEAAAVDCADCHSDEFEVLAASIHGKRPDGAALGAADCEACHGPAHVMRPHSDPASSVHPDHLVQTCGRCHSDPAMAERLGLRAALPVEAYEASVHGRAVARGDAGPTCVTCHGAHDVLRVTAPESPVNHQHVAEACGACHPAEAAAYHDSVHARAVAEGVREAPSCVDCHGEHRILSPTEVDSPVFPTNIPSQTCGPCHGDLRLNEKFGLDPDRIPAFEDSFHGLSLRAGAATVAQCGSCHGVHDVLPSSDPRSRVNPANLAATCGQCHPGAGQTFAIGRVHVVPNHGEHPAVRVVRIAYLWLIALVIGAMVMHNGLDFARKLRGPPRVAPPPRADARERMPLPFRLAHGILVTSFALLVWSGFALSYPDTWWAAPLALGPDPVALRGGLHRLAALVLLAGCLAHGVHLARDRRARACIAAMRPSRRDLSELRERLAWALGRRAEPPRSAWVAYPEKLEYLALVWGVALMAATGFALWGTDWVLRWLPKWVVDLATTIHFYEAVLASLAILVWHFYFVIFDPVVYPMDKAWITGRSHPGRDAERDDPPAQA
jgi:cytochrome b subunit of formate dehydrogenase